MLLSCAFPFAHKEALRKNRCGLQRNKTDGKRTSMCPSGSDARPERAFCGEWCAERFGRNEWFPGGENTATPAETSGFRAGKRQRPRLKRVFSGKRRTGGREPKRAKFMREIKNMTNLRREIFFGCEKSRFVGNPTALAGSIGYNAGRAARGE